MNTRKNYTLYIFFFNDIKRNYCYSKMYRAKMKYIRSVTVKDKKKGKENKSRSDTVRGI